MIDVIVPHEYKLRGRLPAFGQYLIEHGLDTSKEFDWFERPDLVYSFVVRGHALPMVVRLQAVVWPTVIICSGERS